MVDNQIITKEEFKDMALAIDEEVKQDYKNRVKDILIKKRKQIRMMEITLDKAKKEYKEILEGKKIISEEEYLFE